MNKSITLLLILITAFTSCKVANTPTKGSAIEVKETTKENKAEVLVIKCPEVNCPEVTSNLDIRTLIIEPLKMNVFYVGIPNAVYINVPGFATDKLKIATTNGSLSSSDRIFTPTNTGIASISVSVNVDGKVEEWGIREFRVKKIPNPTPRFTELENASSIKFGLLKSLGMIASMPNDFDFDIRFQITSFLLSVNGEEAVSDGAMFSKKQNELIRNAKTRSLIIFTNIKAKGADGEERHLHDLVYKLD